MDIIDQLYNSHVSAATLDALDKYRMHKDQALHGYHVLKKQLTEDQASVECPNIFCSRNTSPLLCIQSLANVCLSA